MNFGRSRNHVFICNNISLSIYKNAGTETFFIVSVLVKEVIEELVKKIVSKIPKWVPRRTAYFRGINIYNGRAYFFDSNNKGGSASV